MINGNTAVIAGAVLFLYKMHKEAMTEIKELSTKVGDLISSNGIHSTELKHGDKRFEKIEEELIYMRKRVHDISNNVHGLKNKVVTRDQLSDILNKGEK